MSLFASEPEGESPGPEGAAAARAEVAAVEEALSRIAPAHREVLLLSAVEGLDSAQVAAVLGIREDAARKRLSRARAELAEWLEKRDATKRKGAPRGLLTKTPYDPLLTSLAELPDVPLDPAAADAVRRRARVALVDGRDGSAPASLAAVRLSFAWSAAILPAILLISGGAYAWGAVRMMERIFLS